MYSELAYTIRGGDKGNRRWTRVTTRAIIAVARPPKCVSSERSNLEPSYVNFSNNDIAMTTRTSKTCGRGMPTVDVLSGRRFDYVFGRETCTLHRGNRYCKRSAITISTTAVFLKLVLTLAVTTPFRLETRYGLTLLQKPSRFPVPLSLPPSNI